MHLHGNKNCVCLLYAGVVRSPPDPHSGLHTATPHSGGGETSACSGTEPDEGWVFWPPSERRHRETPGPTQHHQGTGIKPEPKNHPYSCLYTVKHLLRSARDEWFWFTLK